MQPAVRPGTISAKLCSRIASKGSMSLADAISFCAKKSASRSQKGKTYSARSIIRYLEAKGILLRRTKYTGQTELKVDRRSRKAA